MTIDLDELVDTRTGRVRREVFWDREIYDLELERIFARCWLYLAHESQLSEPGAFITTFMGEDEVIVVRQHDGSVRAMINSCPHRGNRVCHAEAGVARGFVCNYHGWSFAPDGALRGMHEAAAYDQEPSFDQGAVCLPQARVDSYKGLIFGTFDPDAPPLEEYLGAFCWYLDVLLDNDEDGTEMVGGSIRSVLECNWKLAAENFAGDALHAGWTHESGARAVLGQSVPDLAGGESFQANVNGHGWEFNLDLVGNAATLGRPDIVQHLRDRQPQVEARLGKLRSMMVGSISSANIFPNTSFLPGQQTFRIFQPRGPHLTELHTWVLVNRSLDPELKRQYRKGAMLTFSPSGIFEMDDGDNWEQSTAANRGVVTRRQPLNYSLGLSSAVDHPELPGNVFRGQVNDANQRAFYRRWADLLGSTSWEGLST